ncbi:MAG: DUF2490 domain-containing protein [Flavobacteriales bacterium]|nr:DUF2490 domain-containing protein [Flavobacteriales bacterium]
MPRLLLLLLLWWPALCVMAQERVEPRRSGQAWLEAGVVGGAPAFLEGWLGKDQARRFRFAGELGYRTGDELARGRQVILEGQLRYKLHRLVDVSAEQRFAARARERDRHRFGLSAQVGDRVGRFDLGYRLSYQHTFGTEGLRRNTLRNRVDLGYDIPGFRLDPELMVEFFSELGREGRRHDATRFRLGTTWRPAKAHAVGIAVVHDREHGRRRPDQRWVLSLSYTLDLRKL